MKIYLNGQFVTQEDAKISVLDRGFLFGDGVYEVIPVYQRKPFHLKAHLKRLQNSLDGIRMKNPHIDEEWAEIIDHLIDQNESDDKYVYLHISRGVAPKRDHAFPAEIHPTIIGITNPLPKLPDIYFQKGIKTITLEDTRWKNCHYKTTTLLPNVLSRQEAVEKEAVEAILLQEGLMIEGAASNIVIVKDGTIFSPVRDNRMLHGITLDVIELLAKQHHVPMIFRDITVAELKSADEVWLTASTKELLPVTEIDGKPVGNGLPGPLAKQMFDYYQVHKKEPLWSQLNYQMNW